MTSASEELQMSDRGPRWLWGGPAIVAIVGASLWAQTLAAGLGAELRLAQVNPWLLLLYLAPLLALAAAVLLRHSFAALLVFPLAFLPALAALPEADRLLFHDGWAMGRIGLTLAIYLAVTSAWIAGINRLAVEVEPLGKEKPRGNVYRQFALARLVPLVLLFGAPTYGIFFDPAIVGTIAQNYPENEAIAQIFLSIVMFFVWCVVAYTLFLVPTLNIEYDRRHLQRSLDALRASIDRRSMWYRLGAWALGVGCVLLLLLWFV